MLNEFSKISKSEFDLKTEGVKEYFEEKRIPHPDEFNLPDVSGIVSPTSSEYKEVKERFEDTRIPHPDEFNLPNVSEIVSPTSKEYNNFLERFCSFEDDLLTDEELELTEEDLKGDCDVFSKSSTTVEDIFQKTYEQELTKHRKIKAIRSLLKETEEAFIKWSKNANNVLIKRSQNKAFNYCFQVTDEYEWCTIGAGVFEIDEETYLFKILKINQYDCDVKELFVSTLEISDEFIQQKISEYCIRHLFRF